MTSCSQASFPAIQLENGQQNGKFFTVASAPFLRIGGYKYEAGSKKMRPELAKLVPQQPIDAHGLSDCMPRARLFSLTEMKRIF